MATETISADPTREGQIEKALSKFWGFDSLRPLQREVVDASLNNRDAVVVMPTGGGKSLCFQLPAVVSETLTVVVSPLIALMKDQVDALTVVGVPSAALNSSLSLEEEREIRKRLERGEIRVLYVSPERLLLSSTLQMLAIADAGRGVSRFAIDEAHCISAWGHDFRPEFRQLRRIKEVFPGTPVQAFTATATPQVQRDIAIQLGLERPRKFVGVFDRPNLTYRIVAKDDPVRRTVEAVRRYPDEGVIVYCLSRKDTEYLCTSLKAQGIPAVAYHAGLSNETRRDVSEQFAQEKANVVVATVAFGMGIDRSNVRCVIHECLPKSMEGYQQETGRAGRDGLPSECVLLYSRGDVERLKRLLADGQSETVAHHHKLLEEVRRFVNSHECRHKLLSEHFGQAYEVASEGCGACDVCLGGMQVLAEGTEKGQQILRTALSLAARGRGFGAGLLVSVLLGSRQKQVLERNADTVVGFGSFNGVGTERVSFWVHQMADLGLLAISEGQYPMVSVTSEGQRALSDGEPIELIENIALLTPAKTSATPVVENADAALFEKLREWRRTVASDRGVPAYVIFHDATLMRISAVRPSNLERLATISGVGDRRVEEFGDTLVAMVLSHCQASSLPVDQGLVAAPKVVAESLPAKTAHYATYFRQGISVEQIARQLAVTEQTVWTHLGKWVEVEKPESIEAWIDLETQNKVKAAFAAVGSEFLKPAFEFLNEKVPYGQIRLIKSVIGSPSRGV